MEERTPAQSSNIAIPQTKWGVSHKSTISNSVSSENLRHSISTHRSPPTSSFTFSLVQPDPKDMKFDKTPFKIGILDSLVLLSCFFTFSETTAFWNYCCVGRSQWSHWSRCCVTRKNFSYFSQSYCWWISTNSVQRHHQKHQPIGIRLRTFYSCSFFSCLSKRSLDPTARYTRRLRKQRNLLV